MPLTKEEVELSIFNLFAHAQGLLSSGQVENRKPPEPDILYTPNTGPRLAFELVRILDQEYARSVGQVAEKVDTCVEYLDSLPSVKADEFRRKFSNADILIEPASNLSRGRLKNAMSTIFDVLLELPTGYSGEVPVDGSPLCHIVTRVRISRGNFVGPVFDPLLCTTFTDPTIKALSSKMTKVYEPRGKLHLLAYIDGNPMYPDHIWLPKLEDYLSSLDETCQFESIYVYDCGTDLIRKAWHRPA